MATDGIIRKNCDMGEAKKEFQYVVEKYILPLFAYTDKPELKTATGDKINDLIETDEKTGIIRIYPSSTGKPRFYYEVTLDISKNNLAVKLAKEVLNEILRASQFTYGTVVSSKTANRKCSDTNATIYRNARFDLAYELGLCQWFGRKSLYRLLEKIKAWSQKTYEGKRMAFSFIINFDDNIQGNEDFINFLDSNHSAVFTDGISSVIVLDKGGKLVEYFSTLDALSDKDKKQKPTLDARSKKHENLRPYAPYRFHRFAKECYSKRLGIICQTNGDIIIFKNQGIVFVRRNGQWKFVNSSIYIDHIQSHIRDYIQPNDLGDYAKNLYLSLLDVSFAKSGGCIAIIDEKYVDCVGKRYIKDDWLHNHESSSSAKKEEKKRILKELIKFGSADQGSCFFNLDRKLRQELLSLDGATVIDCAGKIHSAGAIVKIAGGSDEGGRSAAAQGLSRYGLAIKISMDGCIQGYKYTEDGESAMVFSLF